MKADINNRHAGVTGGGDDGGGGGIRSGKILKLHRRLYKMWEEKKKNIAGTFGAGLD